MTKRILVVDDDDDVRSVAVLSLRRIGGHEVESISSGTVAVETIAGSEFDVVLLDMQMPVMDGRATLAAIRADERTSGVPVVFLTASVQAQERKEVEALEVHGLLAKPFDPMSLATDLAGLMGW
jgi:two-component system alkaline phosphatase synthesis response regulator PhoP